ncbi:hypothetical protein [Lysobacter sp. CA196]|uniref:hypothetical protein n=1 Tax=Lysobacter sp. CA196 TaxID=3455606 RepID=UPI003F8D13F0
MSTARLLTQLESANLLEKTDLKIGNWGELSTATSHQKFLQHSPSTSAIELYATAHCIIEWLAPGNTTLLLLDNSTMPSDDELETFGGLFLSPGEKWDIDATRGIAWTIPAGGATAVNSAIAIAAMLSTMFGWHAHLASENSTSGKRLGLQDGIIYFYGDSIELDKATRLINQITTNTLSMDFKP